MTICTVTDSDTDLLSDEAIVALTLDGEAENQGYKGQHGVANVIMMRASLDWQRDSTPRFVCLHHAQFSCWNGTNDTNPDRARIMGLDQATDPNFAQCLAIAKLAIAGTLPDITGGADSYEVTGTGAYWAKGLTPSAVIGAHSFYVTRGTT